jgi:hypothetical protein
MTNVTGLPLTTGVTGTLPIANGGTNITTYTTGDLLYASATNVLSKLPAGSANQVVKMSNGLPAWSSVNLSGINYLSANPDFEVDTTGYTVTKNTSAAAAPDSGFSSSSTNITITRTTSTPLRGSGSGLITKDAANRQGEQVYYAFTIDAADQGKLLDLTMDYTVGSGIYADGDIRAYFYDVTNAVFIEPTGRDIKSTTSGIYQTHKATFQTSSNSTSYRLLFHVASTSASAYTLKIDNLRVGPQSTVQGVFVSDWQSFTMTFDAVTTAPTKGTVATDTCYWRRVGDTLELQLRYQQTSAGAAGSGAYLIPLPNGLTIDTSKIGTPNSSYVIPTVGAGRIVGATGDYTVTMAVYSTTRLYPILDNAAANASSWSSSTNPLSNTSISFSAFVRVPIVGWSSGVTYASDGGDGRVVAFRSKTSGVPSGTIGGNSGTSTNILYNSSSFDTHAAYAAGTGIYTVPVAGYYRVHAGIFMSATQAAGNYIDMYIMKNGSSELYEEYKVQSTQSAHYVTVSGIVSCNAGDTLAIRGCTNGTSPVYQSDGTANQFSIEKIQGPSAIASAETVAWYGWNTAGTSIGTSATLIPFTTVNDSHGGWSTNQYTVPVSGRYRISAALFFASASWTADTAYTLAARVDGTYVTLNQGKVQRTATQEVPMLVISHTVRLLAGQVITFVAVQAETAGGRTLNTTAATYNIAAIERVGNY